MLTLEQAAAWEAGFKAGRLDKYHAYRSDYSSISFESEPEWTQYYSAGYRAGRY